MKQPEKNWLENFKEAWRPMGLYEKFEQLVVIVLGTSIAFIVIVSLIQLVRTIFVMLIMDAINPLDHSVFQTVFGMIMTLLIAMEFKHSIIRMSLRSDSIIQVKTVLLIGLIALSRKFVILDPAETSPERIAALSGATMALGAVYWLLRERDDRLAQLPPKNAERS